MPKLFRDMFYVALAADYDGTLAQDGLVPETTIACLRRFRESGRRLILVTGRELPELQRLFPEIGMFDAVVAENGALLFLPAEGEVRSIAPAPPPELVSALTARGIAPLSVGQSIVATWSPHEGTVLEVVHELGLEWQIIFNKGAVMCLPPGINKSSGLAEALSCLKLSPVNVVAIGDAENDHAFLMACGYSAAVANALESVKREVDQITSNDHGAGVCELIARWLEQPDSFGIRASRHGVRLGRAEQGVVRLNAAHSITLIAGASGAGKSSLAMALIEQILASGTQIAVVDPEGDYDVLDGIAQLGSAERAPLVEEAIALLDRPDESVVLGLLDVPIPDRPAFFADLHGAISAMRPRHGRPHWLLLDESHHFFPATQPDTIMSGAAALPGSIFIALKPEEMAISLVRSINTLVVTGPEAAQVVATFCTLSETEIPMLPSRPPGDDEVWFWDKASGDPPYVVTVEEPVAQHKRHIRKYAEGALSIDRSFYFRGPEARLRLRAQNLIAFVELAEGVDSETWLHHLRQGDYSAWFRDVIGDDELADEAAIVERCNSSDAGTSLALIRAAIQRRYTEPAGDE